MSKKQKQKNRETNKKPECVNDINYIRNKLF